MHLTTTFHESCLPHEARAHLQVWTMRMNQLVAMGRGMTTQADALGRQWGTSGATLLRLYYAWIKEGPAALLDKKRYGKYLNHGHARGLPPAFIEYWKGLNERFQRNGGGAQSYRVLMDQLKQWRRGHADAAIPGYTVPPADQPGKLHPVGWTLGNLRRHCPEEVEKAFSRKGRSAAKKYLPKVYSTRVGLEVGQVLMIDDQYWDIEVVWNDGQVARPMSFDLMDLFSGYEIADGFQPSKKADGTTIGLREEDAFWLILSHLMENGYRADIGTHIIVERGTATLRNEIAEGFFTATQGKIIVDKGGIDNRAIKGLIYEGAAKGNFRFKASRESLFNGLRNLCAHLPGPTGRNRDESPDDWGTINREVEKLMKKVPEDRWHLLQLPLLTQAQFMGVAHSIKEIQRNRDDHNLEGWERLGHIKSVFRLPEWGPDEWADIEVLQQRLLELPYEKRELMSLALTSSENKLIYPRKMTPAEVWHAGKGKLTALSIWTWNQIIPARLAHKRHVEDCREIRIYGIASEITRYDAICRNAAGREIMLRPGDEVLVYINPFSPDQALCCDTTGAAIGVLKRIIPHTRIDHAAVLQRMGEVKRITADIESPIARRAENLATERKEMKEHNERVVKGLPVTATEHEQAHKAKQAAKAADAIFDADHASVATPLQAAAPADDTDIMDQ